MVIEVICVFVCFFVGVLGCLFVGVFVCLFVCLLACLLAFILGWLFTCCLYPQALFCHKNEHGTPSPADDLSYIFLINASLGFNATNSHASKSNCTDCNDLLITGNTQANISREQNKVKGVFLSFLLSFLLYPS